MNTIFSYETARISVETLKGMTPTGINTFFIFKAVDSVWVYAREEVTTLGLPVSFVKYCGQHMTTEQRVKMAMAIAAA